MKRLAFLLMPLLLFGCERQPLEPDVRADFGLTGSAMKYLLVGTGGFTVEVFGAPVEVQFMILAQRLSNGRVLGHIMAVKPQDAEPRTLNVTAISPPGTEHPDWWCLEYENPADPAFIGRAYVRDNDGVTSMDQIADDVGISGTCEVYPEPDPSAVWYTLEWGDYRGMIRTK